MLKTDQQIHPYTTSNTLLTSSDKQQYQRDGFLILKNFIAEDICDLLISRARYLVENHDLEETKVIFSTKDQCHAKNLYFLDSGDKIRCFFEENAITECGELKTDRLFCINKIGHALHDLDPVFNCFSRTHKIATIAHELDILDPVLIQSMYIFKQPFIGGEVTCHQDATFLYAEKHPVTGFWFALEDATLENGCLWAIPGGHHTRVKSRLCRNQKNELTTEIYDDTPWPLSNMVPLEVPRGSLIVLHGLLPHMSKENVSPYSRQAYTLHLMSGLDVFAENNWLRFSKSFRGFC